MKIRPNSSLFTLVCAGKGEEKLSVLNNLLANKIAEKTRLEEEEETPASLARVKLLSRLIKNIKLKVEQLTVLQQYWLSNNVSAIPKQYDRKYILSEMRKVVRDYCKQLYNKLSANSLLPPGGIVLEEVEKKLAELVRQKPLVERYYANYRDIDSQDAYILLLSELSVSNHNLALGLARTAQSGTIKTILDVDFSQAHYQMSQKIIAFGQSAVAFSVKLQRALMVYPSTNRERKRNTEEFFHTLMGSYGNHAYILLLLESHKKLTTLETTKKALAAKTQSSFAFKTRGALIAEMRLQLAKMRKLQNQMQHHFKEANRALDASFDSPNHDLLFPDFERGALANFSEVHKWMVVGLLLRHNISFSILQYDVSDLTTTEKRQSWLGQIDELISEQMIAAPALTKAGYYLAQAKYVQGLRLIKQFLTHYSSTADLGIVDALEQLAATLTKAKSIIAIETERCASIVKQLSGWSVMSPLSTDLSPVPAVVDDTQSSAESTASTSTLIATPAVNTKPIITAQAVVTDSGPVSEAGGAQVNAGSDVNTVQKAPVPRLPMALNTDSSWDGLVSTPVTRLFIRSNQILYITTTVAPNTYPTPELAKYFKSIFQFPSESHKLGKKKGILVYPRPIYPKGQEIVAKAGGPKKDCRVMATRKIHAETGRTLLEFGLFVKNHKVQERYEACKTRPKVLPQLLISAANIKK